MDKDTFKDIKLFIERIRWEYPFELRPDTQIEKDLKITGDEAVEFIIAFGKHFNVDVSNFMAADYFEGEGLDLLEALFRRKKRGKKILTIEDLERAIKTGKLDDSILSY